MCAAQVASQFDLSAAMAKADSYLAAQAATGSIYWKTDDTMSWLRKANTYCMPKSQKALAKETGALTDESNLEGLSAETLKQMLMATARGLVYLSEHHYDAFDGDFECAHCVNAHHVLSWVCGNCHNKFPAINTR